MYSTGIINGFLLYCTALLTIHSMCALLTLSTGISTHMHAHTLTHTVYGRGKLTKKHCGEFQCVFVCTHTLLLAHSVEHIHTQAHTHCSFAEKH